MSRGDDSEVPEGVGREELKKLLAELRERRDRTEDAAHLNAYYSALLSLDAERVELSELVWVMTGELRTLKRRLTKAEGDADEQQTEAQRLHEELEDCRRSHELCAGHVERLERENAQLRELQIGGEQRPEARSNAEQRRSLGISSVQLINESLAAANARGAELVCELEAQTERLQDALERVRVLQGLISICMHCHQIRDDNQVWNRLEEYMAKHSDVRFSHGLCPACVDKYYAE